MDGLIVVGIFVLIAGFIGGMIWLSSHLEKKRRESLSAAAESLGLAFVPEGSDSLYQRLSSFHLFNQGRDRKMKNLIQGDAGEVKLAIFDYQYTVGSGKNQSTPKMTIVAIESSQLVCPPLSMRPENLFDKIGGALGFQDLDFESHPKFSNMFVLKSPDESAVRQFMTPQLLTYFESLPGVSLEADRGVMFFYRGSRLCKPEELKGLFAQAYEAYGKIVDP